METNIKGGFQICISVPLIYSIRIKENVRESIPFLHEGFKNVVCGG